jgi:hypothetical protein
MPRPIFNHEVDVTGVAILSHFLYKTKELRDLV